MIFNIPEKDSIKINYRKSFVDDSIINNKNNNV